MKSFGDLLAQYRQDRQMRQSDLATPAGLHPSDLSKIERGIRKPPRPENTRRLIEILHLSPKEATALLTAGGYSLPEVGNIQFDRTAYPDTTPEKAEMLLNGERGYWPVWELDLQGNIQAANLLAFWLWGALGESEDTLDADALLGWNVYDIYIREANFCRIAMPGRKTDFWYTNLMEFKKLVDVLPGTTVSAVKERIFDNAILSLVYEYGGLDLDEEWSYTLRIQPFSSILTSDYGLVYLEFEVRVEQIKQENQPIGFVVVFQPLRQTIKIIEEAYRRLREQFVRDNFVQYSRGLDMEMVDPYPPFFPQIVHDLLWEITESNKAHRLLLGSSFEGMHFFDMLLSPQMQDLAGPTGNDSTYSALGYFLSLTASYQDETHDLHKQYDQVTRHLYSNPAFVKAVTQYWQDFNYTNIVVDPHDGEVIFKLCLRCRYTNTFQMYFDSIPRFPRRNQPDYRVIYVPSEDTRQETKAALVLMFVEDGFTRLEDIGSTPIRQLMWGLAVVRTVKEGIVKDKGAVKWDPDMAFKYIRQALDEEYEHVTQPTVEDLTLQVRMTVLGMYMHCSPSTRAHITEMLLHFTKKAPFVHDILFREQGGMSHDIQEPDVQMRDQPLQENNQNGTHQS